MVQGAVLLRGLDTGPIPTENQFSCQTLVACLVRPSDGHTLCAHRKSYDTGRSEHHSLGSRRLQPQELQCYACVFTW